MQINHITSVPPHIPPSYTSLVDTQNNTPNNTPPFKSKHPLKTMWKQGKLPTVKIGLYNKKLTKDNISIEHELPRSLNGTSGYKNVALADKITNGIRSSQDIRLFLTKGMIINYLQQFIDVVVKRGNHIIFRGNNYIKLQIENFKKLGYDFN